MKKEIHIQLMIQDDIQTIAAAFDQLGWNKPASQYEHYLKDQDAGKRVVLVATIDGEFAGYVTILWESSYPYFWQAEIPEIVDFNVLPKFRQQGVGSQLMDEAECRIAERSLIAGIGVGLTADYGAAQILYVKRGYIPNGRGIVKDGKPLINGERISLDDGVILYFTKVLIS